MGTKKDKIILMTLKMTNMDLNDAKSFCQSLSSSSFVDDLDGFNEDIDFDIEVKEFYKCFYYIFIF